MKLPWSLTELNKTEDRKKSQQFCRITSFFFTSTSLLVQEFVPRGTVTLVTNSAVPADVGAAAIVVCTLVQACRGTEGAVGGRDRGRDRDRRGGKY